MIEARKSTVIFYHRILPASVMPLAVSTSEAVEAIMVLIMVAKRDTKHPTNAKTAG